MADLVGPPLLPVNLHLNGRTLRLKLNGRLGIGEVSHQCLIQDAWLVWCYLLT